MTRCTPDQLLAHADAIAHTAAVGGYVDERTGERVTLSPERRDAWARDAGVLRAAAIEGGAAYPGGGDD
jgi:hypothetical protein